MVYPHFRTTERAMKIVDENFTNKYILGYSPSYAVTTSAETLVISGISGGGNPLVPARENPDRNEEFTLVNVQRIDEFEKVIVDVPSGIKGKVEEYNVLKNKLEKNHPKDINDILTEQEIKDINKLKEELNNYFVTK